MNAIIVLPPLSVVLLIVLGTGIGCYTLRNRTARLAAPHELAALGLSLALVGLTAAVPGVLPGPAWLPAAVLLTGLSSVALRRIGSSIARASAFIDETTAEFARPDAHPAPSLEVVRYTAAQDAGSARRRSLRKAS